MDRLTGMVDLAASAREFLAQAKGTTATRVIRVESLRDAEMLIEFIHNMAAADADRVLAAMVFNREGRNVVEVKAHGEGFHPFVDRPGPLVIVVAEKTYRHLVADPVLWRRIEAPRPEVAPAETTPPEAAPPGREQNPAAFLGCAIPAVFVLVIWPLTIIPYLRMRLPGVEIAPKFADDTLVGVLLGAVAGVVVAVVLMLIGPFASDVLAKGSRLAGIAGTLVSIAALVAAIVLIDRYAFRVRWGQLAAAGRTCIGSRCPDSARDVSVTILAILVTIQLACCLAIVATPWLTARKKPAAPAA